MLYLPSKATGFTGGWNQDKNPSCGYARSDHLVTFEELVWMRCDYCKDEAIAQQYQLLKRLVYSRQSYQHWKLLFSHKKEQWTIVKASPYGEDDADWVHIIDPTEWLKLAHDGSTHSHTSSQDSSTSAHPLGVLPGRWRYPLSSTSNAKSLARKGSRPCSCHDAPGLHDWVRAKVIPGWV